MFKNSSTPKFSWLVLAMLRRSTKPWRWWRTQKSGVSGASCKQKCTMLLGHLSQSE